MYFVVAVVVLLALAVAALLVVYLVSAVQGESLPVTLWRCGRATTDVRRKGTRRVLWGRVSRDATASTPCCSRVNQQGLLPEIPVHRVGSCLRLKSHVPAAQHAWMMIR